jgi:cytidine deaminase
VTAPPTQAQLRAAALDVMRYAYAPYSGFRVGAALAATDTDIFVGCNVENAAYGSSVCAERSAVLAAVAHGVRDFHQLVIATDGEQPTPPCGACRQMLSEFTTRLEITSCTTRGAEQRWNLSDLLPYPFTPRSLDRA